MFSVLGPFVEFEEIDLPEFWGDMDNQKHIYEDFDNVLLETDTLLSEKHASKTQNKLLENLEDQYKHDTHRKSTLPPSLPEWQRETTARQESNKISTEGQDTESAGEQELYRESVTEQGQGKGSTMGRGTHRGSTSEQRLHRDSVIEQGSQRGSIAEESRRGSLVEQGPQRGSIAEESRRGSLVEQGPQSGSIIEESRRGSIQRKGTHKGSIAEQGSRRGSITEEGSHRESVTRKGSHKGLHRESVLEEPQKESTEEQEPPRGTILEQQDIDSTSRSSEKFREATHFENIEIPPQEERPQEQVYVEELFMISELQEEDRILSKKDHLSGSKAVLLQH